MPPTERPGRRTIATLVAFVAVLAASLGIGWAVGAAAGPEPPRDDVPGHDMGHDVSAMGTGHADR